MSTLTIRLPDDKHLRLRKLAKHRAISIAEFDAATRFRTLAARDSAKKGLAILDKLDAAFVRKGKLFFESPVGLSDFGR